MSLFGGKEKKTIIKLTKQLAEAERKNKQLKQLCKEKDSFFSELMSDALRHGSSLAAKHMSDRKKYLNGK